MKLIDITWTLQEAPVYPGMVPSVIDRVEEIKKGSSCNFSMVKMASHAGTHADALCHFIDDGKTMEEMPLEHYYGPCRVLTFDTEEIRKADLEGKIDGIKRLVIHGGGKAFLSPEACRYLVDSGIITVVTDAMSVGPVGLEKEPHLILLGAGIALVETVKLDGVEDGDYTLCAFPAKYGGCDGAPVRAILIAE